MGETRGQGGHIAQAQIQALRGIRMHGVGGVANQHHTLVSQPARALTGKRMGPPCAAHRDAPQPCAETPFKFGTIGNIVQLERRQGARLVQTLHADIARAAARNHGKRPFASEMFKGGVGLRMFHLDLRYQGMLAVVITIGLDATGATHGGGIAIGADQQRGAHIVGLVALRYCHFDMLIDYAMADVTRCPTGVFAHRREHRAAQFIEQDIGRTSPAQGVETAVVGMQGQGAKATAIADANVANGCRVGRKPRPYAER